MWWDKKPRSITPNIPQPEPPPPATPIMDNSMPEINPKMSSSISTDQNQTRLGRSVVMHGELSGSEDLLIEGQFEGTINLQEHCVTVGSHGQVKAEIHARQVVVLGTVTGNVSASEKIEIRKSGHVLGDLNAAGVSIEDGAYFKGSIEIQREERTEAQRALTSSSAGFTNP